MEHEEWIRAQLVIAGSSAFDDNQVEGSVEEELDDSHTKKFPVNLSGLSAAAASMD